MGMATNEQVVNNTEEAYRRAGYVERVQIDTGTGWVSFAPGAWRCQLELYDPRATGANDNPALRVQHTTADTVNEALMIITPDQAHKLILPEYNRIVLATSPQGEIFVLVDGKLVVKR